MKDLDSLALKYDGGRLLVLDQRLLPHEERWVQCHSPDDMCHIIKTLQVRGAPLIGIAAALAIADFAARGASESALRLAAKNLLASRPTAVNLRLAMDRLIFNTDYLEVDGICLRAVDLFEEDRRLCDAMAEHGASLIADGDNLVTHCNTGSLVTTGTGTALGVIKRAWQQGKRVHVFVDETRPLLQGARLTTWELQQAGIPHTLITDSMAAGLMAQRRIDKVFLGADRIAANGDFANKIGTYNLAVVAQYHGIPFYVVAPYTTVDFECPDGSQIPIEERNPEEVGGFASVADGQPALKWTLPDVPVFNPAFDVTPAALVSGIVLDKGIFGREDLQAGALAQFKSPFEK
jgi:methylthioribose-1-phosphate isomerase